MIKEIALAKSNDANNSIHPIYGAKTLNRLKFETGSKVFNEIKVVIDCKDLNSGCLVNIELQNIDDNAKKSNSKVYLDKLFLFFDLKPVKFLEHGWQSWSPVAPLTGNAIKPLRLIPPKWVRSTYHIDDTLAGRVAGSDQFFLCKTTKDSSDAAIIGAVTGRTNLTSFFSNKDEVVAVIYLDNITINPGLSKKLDPIWFSTSESSGILYSKYLDIVSELQNARTKTKNRFGWCSWYNYFMKISPSDLDSNLPIADKLGLDLMQLDDGYSTALGDWLSFKDRFKENQLGQFVKNCRDKDIEPGIWTAPFLIGKDSSVYKEHRDWLVKDKRGKPLLAIWNKINWRGAAYSLDTTNPKATEYLKNTFSELTQMGFTYHKIDFCYAAGIRGIRHKSYELTRAESLVLGLNTIREAISDDSFLLGCGCPLLQAVGIVDAMRVSPDTAPKYSPGIVQVPGYPESSPALKNALYASILRSPMHRRLWINDPDCLLLRPTRTRLSDKKRIFSAICMYALGGFVVLSDDLNLYTESEFEIIKLLKDSVVRADQPITLSDPFNDTYRLEYNSGSFIELDLKNESVKLSEDFENKDRWVDLCKKYGIKIS